MRFSNGLGEQRVRKYFALFPVSINGETIWLETVEFIQEWCKNFESSHHWHNVGFINKYNKNKYSKHKRYGWFKCNFI